MKHRFVGRAVQEGVQTGDGRIIAAGALTWETPIPFAWLVTGSQHVFDGEAPVIGNVDELIRGDDGWITCTGFVDDETDAGAEMVHQLQAGSASHGSEMGVSVDMDDMAIEGVDNTLGRDDDPGPVVLLAAARWRIEGLRLDAGQEWPAVVAAAGDPDSDDGEIIFEEDSGDVLMRVTRARIRGLTAVATPAFDQARVSLETDAGAEMEGSADEEPPNGLDPEVVEAVDAVTAAAPIRPPRAWFDDPALLMPTPLTITDEGRVLGHVAAWGTCHRSYADRCVVPPRGTDYASFHHGSVVCDNDDEVRTGTFVWGTSHATLDQTLIDAFQHYEVARYGFADVRVGEDEHGIWFSGALRPDVTDEDVRVLRALSVSGDWRSRAGRLELITGLAVNVPGFPIAEPDPVVASVRLGTDHHPVALVAAGVVPQPSSTCSCTAGSGEDRLARIEAGVAQLTARTEHLVPAAMAAAAARVQRLRNQH